MQAAVAPSTARPTITRPTIADVQPLLTRLLQQIESGWGDNVIDELSDRGVRRAPPAQAVARQIDAMFDSVRPVRITRSDFRGEMREGRLVVTGHVQMQVRDAAAPTRQLALQAEFIERNGSPMLSSLAPVP